MKKEQQDGELGSVLEIYCINLMRVSGDWKFLIFGCIGSIMSDFFFSYVFFESQFFFFLRL